MDDRQFGDCIVYSHQEIGKPREVTIGQADPVVLVADGLLEVWEPDAGYRPWVEFTLAERAGPDKWHGATIVIDDGTRRVTYVVGEAYDRHRHVARWPGEGGHHGGDGQDDRRAGSEPEAGRVHGGGARTRQRLARLPAVLGIGRRRLAA